MTARLGHIACLMSEITRLCGQGLNTCVTCKGQTVPRITKTSEAGMKVPSGRIPSFRCWPRNHTLSQSWLENTTRRRQPTKLIRPSLLVSIDELMDSRTFNVRLQQKDSLVTYAALISHNGVTHETSGVSTPHCSLLIVPCITSVHYGGLLAEHDSRL